MNRYWEKNEVVDRLERKMASAFHSVYELARKDRLFLRDAACAIAIQRVAQACQGSRLGVKG